ncbi:hypothetical protein GCM10022224_026470 [Nonomuraea antimicrobica]|uniref:Uncharacterized protein n=1 Tax=Nonomuraea antimicrobica TaxID=561173 RepID=A0ABP7BIH2_9ACTN
MRNQDIIALNQGRTMNNGRPFTQGEWLQPGITLHLPADARPNRLYPSDGPEEAKLITTRKALNFYVEALGFTRTTSRRARSGKLSLVSPEASEGTELLLEPDRQPCGQAVRRGGGHRRHSGHVAPGGGCAGGVRAAARAGGYVHAGAEQGEGRVHDDLRRHLRKLDPERDPTA